MFDWEFKNVKTHIIALSYTKLVLGFFSELIEYGNMLHKTIFTKY